MSRSLLYRYIKSDFFKVSVFVHSFLGMGCGTMAWCSSPPILPLNRHIDVEIGKMFMFIGGGTISGCIMGATFPISHMVFVYRAIMYKNE